MNNNIIIKKEQVDPIEEQQDYFHLEFSEKYFNSLENKEKYYLDVYSRIYDLIQSKKLKMYDDFPKQVIYQSGVCYAVKRQVNSSLDRIIINMSGSRYYRCDKGKVYNIGSLVYLDGFFKFDKKLGIRVVRVFSKSQKQLNQEVQKFIDIILVHIYNRDLENGNYKQKTIDEVYSKSKQNYQNNEDSNSMIDEDQSDIYESEPYMPPSQIQQKLNQQVLQKSLKENQNQEEFEYIEQPQKIKDNKINKDESDRFKQLSLQNLQVDVIANMPKQQLKPELKQQQLQQQGNINFEYNLDSQLSLKSEIKLNIDEKNQVQQALYLLYMQNNELQQILTKRDIAQKKAEVAMLEQKLNKLVQEKELYTQQPQQLNIAQIIQNNIKKEEYDNQN
ncbi:hypothetical protein TTHERM_00912350 (macronuclear) [Tetrahymena thermophila SB210]|uniref:Uncharacterized protein n=1 Tax=Tetrahymena thermophila (strain SB210) TaxID=312017 RepID=Q23TU0_TETTS|nr:hypothetical protein TTHERM_00912350 [Tetrahymena thermophila SB210]EAR99955.3 hypothetical protein TTHERM_00912350 [Tetrahymena thermophila SB210]|eukprot:XP_001020200.3 hypothetical protein TTHERM_00912350 [Tetrahymena thermophila SB210]